MKKIAFHWQILISLVFAVIFGIYFPAQVKYISWMGDVFLRLLKMLIIPLVLSSLISGVTNIGGSRNLGRLGLKTMTYYIVTSIFAILTGLLLMNLFKPGVEAELNFTQTVDSGLAKDSLGDILLKVIPENIFLAFTDNAQLLSVILFSLLFGFFINQVENTHSQRLKDFFNSMFEVMMKLTLFIIRFTPFGILGLVATKVSQQSDLIALIQSMGMYMLVVILGLLIHAGITLPLLLKLVGKVNPLKHLKALQVPLITAFSTASSNATLPLTMEATEKNAGVSNKITSFTLPLGATVNMDGTALYECAAVIFISQVYGVELTFAQQLVVVITALLASIGAAGIPMAGLVMITIVLTAVGLPLEGVGLILAVDPLLDMFRTAVNVWSDSCGAVIIAKTEGEVLMV
ncbi:MAG: dicarboxylate/amino acid:cation symporter [Bacteroidales bacterium]|jgi:Na+/H+-dicarboxylate symporter|nr:dicarboxylate/amino acid:cation symporter [Bacteroidales bacterium]